MVCNENIIGQLKEGQPCAFNLLYRTYYPVIEKFILANSGSIDDARDIFQDTMIIFNRNLSAGLQLTSSLKTYLYAISKNLWLKTLRDRGPTNSFELDEHDLPERAREAYDEKEKADALFHEVNELIARMPLHCQKIVQYVYYDNVPVDEMAKKMGYTNAHTASNAKYKCLQQVKKVEGH